MTSEDTSSTNKIPALDDTPSQCETGSLRSSAHGDIQEDGILAQLQSGFALCVRDAVRFWQSLILGARCHQLGALVHQQEGHVSAVVDELVAVVLQTVLGVDLFAGLVSWELLNCARSTQPAVSASPDSGVAWPQKHLRRLLSNIALYQLCDAAISCLADAWQKKKKRSCTWMSACTAAPQTTPRTWPSTTLMKGWTQRPKLVAEKCGRRGAEVLVQVSSQKKKKRT